MDHLELLLISKLLGINLEKISRVDILYYKIKNIQKHDNEGRKKIP